MILGPFFFFAYLKETGGGDEDHECLSQVVYALEQGPVELAPAAGNTGRALQDVHHEHPVLGEEAPALQHVV